MYIPKDLENELKQSTIKSLSLFGDGISLELCSDSTSYIIYIRTPVALSYRDLLGQQILDISQATWAKVRPAPTFISYADGRAIYYNNLADY